MTEYNVVSYNDPNCQYCHNYMNDTKCICVEVLNKVIIHMEETTQNLIKHGIILVDKLNIEDEEKQECLYCHYYISDADCTC